MESNCLISDIQDTGVLLYALQQENLVYNYNFLYFSNKTSENPDGYGHPDGWVYQDVGGEIGFGSSENIAYCMITKSNNKNTMTFQQYLHEIPRWENKLKGKLITAKVVMNVSADCDARVTLTDGINQNIEEKKTTGDVEFDLQLTVGKAATGLFLKIESSTASAEIKIYRAYANIGEIAIETLPCIIQGVIGERKQYIATDFPPAGELSLCNESKELEPDKTRLDSVINKRFGAGVNNLSLLPDVRGYFSRSWDNKSGNDPDAGTRENAGKGTIQGDHTGTVEGDIFKEHNHTLNFSPVTIGLTGGEQAVMNTAVTSDTRMTEGKETRPKNISELYTIKWA